MTDIINGSVEQTDPGADERIHDHDGLHGGLGDDIINGGDGADWVFDNGADSPQGEDETQEQYRQRLLAYDGEGNDLLDGGAGSDVLVYSGGTDVFTGGAGDDTYILTDQAAASLKSTDHLTIMLSGDFGHDTIAGDGMLSVTWAKAA